MQVLRMQPGEKLKLTNGNGIVACCTITEATKRQCYVTIDGFSIAEKPRCCLHLAVSFTKNVSRNEWLLEKATELGVATITPLLVTRTERDHFRHDRWNNILVSAMVQSQQFYLPQLNQPSKLADVLDNANTDKFIAHCIPGMDRKPLSSIRFQNAALILIGPEGDFTNEEISLAMEKGCKGIELGNTRLRTETAAISACAYYHLTKEE